MQLVLNTFGASLQRRGELFHIVAGERSLEIAARKVQSILLTTGIHFSSDAIRLAAEHNIDVVMLDKFGQPYGRFWMARMGSTAAIRRAQLSVADSAEGLEIVKHWTLSKLRNQHEFLNELSNRRPQQKQQFNEVIERILVQEQMLQNLAGLIDERRNQILAIEGQAAAVYWDLLGKLPPVNFQFTSRSKHPAHDPFNATLNYAYGILYSMVDRACTLAGLDPFVGILHTDNYNKRSLVFDLIEPFRIWADRVVLKLFTGRRCKEDMFRRGEDNDGIVLEKSAKELLLPEIQNFLDEPIRYKIKSSRKQRTRQIKRRDCIQAEAHTFANRLLGKDGGLPKVMETRNVFGNAEDPSNDKEGIDT